MWVLNLPILGLGNLYANGFKNGNWLIVGVIFQGMALLAVGGVGFSLWSICYVIWSLAGAAEVSAHNAMVAGRLGGSGYRSSSRTAVDDYATSNFQRKLLEAERRLERERQSVSRAATPGRAEPTPDSSFDGTRATGADTYTAPTGERAAPEQPAAGAGWSVSRAPGRASAPAQPGQEERRRQAEPETSPSPPAAPPVEQAAVFAAAFDEGTGAGAGTAPVDCSYDNDFERQFAEFVKPGPVDMFAECTLGIGSLPHTGDPYAGSAALGASPGHGTAAAGLGGQDPIWSPAVTFEALAGAERVCPQCGDRQKTTISFCTRCGAFYD